MPVRCVGIDGADGAGKTTFAAALDNADFDAPVLREAPWAVAS